MYDGCPKATSAPPPSIVGDLGWPCPHGIGLHLQATTAAQHLVNCVVFYYPISLGPGRQIRAGENCILSRFHRTWQLLVNSASQRRLTNLVTPGGVQLNSIAADFSRLLQRFPKKNQAAYNFKAVVVVPVYGHDPDRPSGDGAVRASAGFSGSGARFLSTSVDVPFEEESDHTQPPPAFDLNEIPQGRALTLFLIAALPPAQLC